MQKIKITVRGSTPLLMHSVALADPDSKWAKEIASVTSKRKKTEEDRQRIATLEWMGGLYTEGGRVVMPTANVRKSIIRAATITRQGTAVGRALVFTDVNVPLEYEGPKDIEALAADPAFRHTAVVTVGQSKVVRTRPMFPNWGLSVTGYVEESVLDFDDLCAIARQAGITERLGDFRSGGFGAFEARTEAL